MSIRLAIFCVIVAALMVYAWKDWFLALCAAIAFTALAEHEDMPRSMFGMAGMTPWNFLLIGVVAAFLVERQRSGRRWDMSPGMRWVFFGYLAVLVISGVRGTVDATSIDPWNGANIASTPGKFAIEHLINPFKLMLPALMVYDGVRTRRQVVWALVAIGAMGALYALLVCRRIDMGFLVDGSQHLRARLKLQQVIGLHANDLATILGATCWGMLASISVWKSRGAHVLCLAIAMFIGLGMVLCFSRAGYIAFVGVGATLAVLRWRKLLFLLPVGVVMIALFFPNVITRVTMGFGEDTETGETATNMEVVTAGRSTDIWPPTLEQIAENPVFGYGRRAILRTPIYDKLRSEFGACPGHPHNAYMEIVLDGGILSLVPVLIFFGGIWVISARLFRTRGDPLAQGVGGLSLAHVTVLLITAMSAQSFYPKRSMVAMLCAWALAARVWELRRKRVASRPVVRMVSAARPTLVSHLS